MFREFNVNTYIVHLHIKYDDIRVSDISLALVGYGALLFVFIGYEIYSRKKKLEKRFAFSF